MKVILYLLFTLFLSVSVFADPFNANRVPEKAKWYLHFDMDNFKKTSIGKNLIEKTLEDPGVAQLNDVLRLIGIDPAKNLKNITIYGMDFNKSNWLLVYEGSVYVVKLLDLIKTNGTYEVNNNSGIDVYSTVYSGNKFYFFIQDNILYASKEIHLINAHIQMVTGQEKSLKDVNIATGISMNSLMVFGSADRLPDDGKDATMSEIIKIVTKISGGVKEESGIVKAEVVLETASQESADTLNQFLQGIIGMGKLKFSKVPELLEAVKGIVVTKDNTKIMIKGSLSSDVLFTLIKQKDEQKKNRAQNTPESK
jgi:hypothetical protein